VDLANEYIKDNYQYMTDKEMGEALGLSAKAVKNRRHRMVLMKVFTVGDLSSATESQGVLDEARSSMEQFGVIDKVSVTKYITVKDKGLGEPSEKTSNTRTSIYLKPDVESKLWDPITQSPPIIIKPVKYKAISRDTKVAVILPDPQIGYRLDPRTGELDPFHDERAMNIALQLIQELQPDKIVNLGDFLDLPQYSKYPQEPLFAHTTQPSLDRASSFLAEQRANAPKSEIVLLEGNHDKRLMDFIMRNAMAAFGIKRANSLPDDWPVMSIPYLLRVDEIGVKYIEGYPTGEYYINDSLKCIHGMRIGKRGRASHMVIEDELMSTITGHTHHIEVAYRTIHKRSELSIPFAAILGCLCRIDGAVPSVHSGLKSNGKPIRNFEDWQQGIGIVHYDEDGQDQQLNVVNIKEGKAIFQGRKYAAVD